MNGRRRKIVDEKVVVDLFYRVFVVAEDDDLSNLVLSSHIDEEIIEKFLFFIIAVIAPQNLQSQSAVRTSGQSLE